jgi:putative tricarboxylic transport membrane protein
MNKELSGSVNDPVTLRKRADIISVVVWITLGVVVLKDSLKLSYLAEYGPGAGFLPFWLGVAIIIGAVGIVLESLFLRTGGEKLILPSKIAGRQLVLVIVALLGFVFLIERAGFSLSVGLLFLFLLGVVEHRGWFFSLVMAGVSGGIFWFIFERLFQMNLPAGFLEYLF